MIWLAIAAAAPCDPSILNPALARAENAYLLADPAELKKAAAEVRHAARCDDLPPGDVARVLRLAALEHALDNHWEAVVVDLRASLAAHPLLPLEPGLAADPRLNGAWLRAQESPITWTFDASGASRVNGLPTRLRPDTPTWESGGRASASGARRSTRWAALGVGVLAGGLYGGAWVSRGRYDDLAGGPAQDVLPAYRTTNALAAGSVGAALAAAGLIGVSFAL